MSVENLAHYIDHTLLKPEATRAEIATLVEEALELGAYSVCVSPNMLPLAIPPDSKLKVVAVCGFPSGKHDSTIKAAEAALAVKNGADEVDMVIDIGAARAGRYRDVENDIRTVRRAVPAPTVLKVIIEAAVLDDDAVVKTCEAAVRAQADFVKTSTGFHPAGGASVHAVALMSKVVGGKLGVKAAGGIHSRAAAEALIAAGATRIGASRTRAILAEIPTPAA